MLLIVAWFRVHASDVRGPRFDPWQGRIFICLFHNILNAKISQHFFISIFSGSKWIISKVLIIKRLFPFQTSTFAYKKSSAWKILGTFLEQSASYVVQSNDRERCSSGRTMLKCM